MIVTIYHLGKRSMEDKSSLVQALTLPLLIERGGKTQYAVTLDFDLKKNKINIPPPEEINDESPIKYLWIGSADGPNSPQWYVTVSNVEYLLNQTIYNLLSKWDPKHPSYKLLEQTLRTFFLDVKFSKKSEERYRYVVNPIFFGETLEASDAKKAKEEVTKKFHQYLKGQLNIDPNDVAIYSLAINGQRIVEQSEYEKLVLEEKDLVFEKAEEGVCSVTNERTKVTGDTTRLKFNYYINDKLNFSSQIEKKNFVKNMALSKKAYHYVMAGESYILRNFDTRFGNISCYVIPQFLYEPPNRQVPLNEWASIIKNLVRTVKSVETMENLRTEIETYLYYEDQMNQVNLNFLFHVKAQASFKIVKLLQDVPMQQVRDLAFRMNEIEQKAKELLGDHNWKIGLSQIYYLIPMKEQRGDNYEKRKILTVYESLLSRKPISYDWLITQFTQLAKIYYFKQTNAYQIKDSNSDTGMVRAVLQSQMLLNLLQSIEVLKGGIFMESIEYQLSDEHLVNYMKEMKYDAAQSALFLLGVLIAKIGAEQRKTYDHKPILSKINFQGMNQRKIRILSLDIFGKLRQVKILNTQNEMIYAEHQKLLGRSSSKWNISDRETSYFILSGYSYQTQRLISSGKKKEGVESN